MITPTLRRIVTVFALSLICVAGALAQSPMPATWEGARAKLDKTKHKVYVVTVADPTRRQVCRVDSISDSEIVCRQRGQTAAYQANDVAALILPGGHTSRNAYFMRFLAAGAAAMGAAGIFALVCPACALTSVAAALVLFAMAPISAILAKGDTGDTLLYLAPGQTLKVSLD